MEQETAHQQIGRAIDEGWSQAGSFFGSIISGMLLGLLADNWLGTEPWLVVIGSVVGIYSGFLNMWRYSKKIEEESAR
ncbi:MAG TPA: AtpZ/AtpI family protein [Acidimicrobiia bacterium]